MEVSRAEIDAVYDAHGRFVWTPHAVTLDGQRNIPCDLQPGETLAAFLERHVPGIHSGAWVVSIGGQVVPQRMWARTRPKHGMHIACRATVGRQVLAIVAVAVLSYFTMGAGAAWIGTAFGVGAGAAAAIGMGMFVAGSMLINKVLAPKVPKAGEAAAARDVYSLRNQRNSIRAYEPIPVLWGEMRVNPDLASQPYVWFEGDDQYLSTILLGGINVHSAHDIAIGDTPISSYSEVELYYNGFPGHTNQDVPLYSNIDMVAGGELENDGAWITRTGSAGAVVMQVDIEGRLYDVDGEGNIKVNSVPLYVEYRAVGSGSWLTFATQTLTNASMDVVRRTLSLPVPEGQYEVRVRLGAPTWNEGAGKDACDFTFQSLKSIQPDATDYSQWGRLGIKIRASGQLSGGLDTVAVTYRAKPMPVWTGAAWVTATTRETGLSNPGAIILQALRGVRDPGGRLQFGLGLDDAQIDIDGLKAFMLHCAANGYTYDRWITGSTSIGQFLEEVALAGMGQFTWLDGSRPGVAFVASGQPIGGVVNMANMLKASFSVDYALSNAADGIEYQYLDRCTWETKTLRVMAPGVTTMLNPARVTGEGVTSEAHAAVLARYHLAQSLYQYKTIGYAADIEHLDYRRLSVLSLSHDLTQWGYGGRLVSAAPAGGTVVLTLDEPVPPLPTPHVGLRLPGDRDYRVFQVQPLAAESNQLTLIGAWPAGVDLPGTGPDNPAHDTLWCYDFKTTPGYRVRVVSMEPESDLQGARISCVPEGPEFWDYVLNGTYVPAPAAPARPQLDAPIASNLRVTEVVHLQGDTEWYELSCIWDVSGAFDHAQVWAARDGAALRLVDGNAIQPRTTFRIDGAGDWTIQVRPFDARGRAGTAATLVYITNQVGLAPWNPTTFVVHVVDGNLRRFAWAYSSDRPSTLAGVQIRYRAGSVPATAVDWDSMTPLGAAGDIYTAQFETTAPGEGTWTFALRAINTDGALANSVLSYTAALPGLFADIQAPDLTPPPAPTGLAAVGGLSTVIVSWDAPSYTAGHGHGRTRIYAAEGAAAVLADATQVAEGYAGPASFAVAPGTVWRVWAKHESVDGGLSAAAGPVSAEAGQDVSGLLDALAGQIGAGQLSPALSTEIGHISGSGAGSVNARIQAEAQALQSNIDAVSAQVADIIGVDDYDPAKAYSTGDLVKYDNKLYRAKSGTVGNLPTNTTYWELVGEYASIGDAVAAHALQLTDHETRIANNANGLTAEANARDALAVQMRGGYTGTNVNSVSSGLIYSERQARAAGDSANTSLINGVRADLTDAENDISAHTSAISALQSTVTSQGNTLTSQSSSITTLNNSLATTNGNVTAAQNAAQAAADAAGAKGKVIFGSTAPAVGDRLAQNLWIDTTGNANTPKRWNGSAWVAVTDKVATDAAAAALAAQNAVATKADASALTALDAKVTSAEGAITSQGTQLTQLAATINSAGTAVNRLANATFAQVTGGVPNSWEVYSNPGTNGPEPVTLTTVAGSDGYPAVRVTWTGSNTTTKGICQLGIPTPMKANAWYVVACKVRAVTGTLGAGVSAQFSNNPQFSDFVTISSPNLTANWQWYVAKFRRTAGDSDQVFFSITGVTSSGAYEIATPIVHEGQVFAGFNEGPLAAALQTEANVRASTDGYLGAQYTVKMQLSQGGKQVVGGFGITGTSSDTAGPTIDFGVLANSFWVAAPTGSPATSIKPFSVQTTSQTVNGVVIPAGVYMDAAYINNVTALYARFGTLIADSVQATAISASQLTLGDGTVGGNLKSSTFTAGSAGWILRPDGTAEMNNITVRGTIYSTSGQIGGITINANGLNSGAFTGYAWPASGAGFHLGPNGLLLGNHNTGRYIEVQTAGNIYMPGLNILNGNATFSGALSAATGTFAGSLSAATGTFSGSLSAATGTFSGALTASAINAVNTINIAGNAVTVPAGAVGGYVYGGDSKWYTAVGLSFPCSGGLVYVSGFARSSTAVRIVRNGSVIATSGVNGSPSKADYPGAGTHLYEVQFFGRIVSGDWSSVDAFCAESSIFCLEAKR